MVTICSFDCAEVTGRCGDGIAQDNEECDGSDLGGESCGSQGFVPTPDLSCDASCRFDASACALCDDLSNNGEETDVDCGGPHCDPCPDQASCLVGRDCISGACSNDACEFTLQSADGLGFSGSIAGLPMNGTISMVGYDQWPAGVTTPPAAFVGGVFDGQSVWMAPRTASHVVKIDTTSGVMTAYNNWPTGMTLPDLAFKGAMFDGQKVWLVPNEVDRVVAIDKDTGLQGPAEPPHDDALLDLLDTVADKIEAALGDDEVEDSEGALAPLYAAAVRGRSAGGSRAGKKTGRLGVPTNIVDIDTDGPIVGPRCVRARGFSLHANTRSSARDRAALERLCRYTARGPSKGQ